MSTAVTPPTPENVADMIAWAHSDYHDGNEWYPGVSRDGNVLSITITPYDEGGSECPKVEFQAVVVEGDQPPIVLPRPADPGDLPADSGLYLDHRPGFVQIGDRDEEYTPDQARLYAAHIAALADLAEQEAGA